MRSQNIFQYMPFYWGMHKDQKQRSAENDPQRWPLMTNKRRVMVYAIEISAKIRGYIQMQCYI